MLVTGQFETEVGWEDDVLAFVGQGILRACAVEGEGEGEVTVWGGDGGNRF